MTESSPHEALAADLERWAASLPEEADRDEAAKFAGRIRRLAFFVPEVAVVDPEGKSRETGFYFEMPARQGYPVGDGKPEDIPTTRCLAHYWPGDWGLSNTPRLAEVTPPHRFVPTGRFAPLLDPPGA